MSEITIETIRAELAEMDAAYHDLPDYMQDETPEQEARMKKAESDMDMNLAAKLHLLLDTIDKLQAENKRLREDYKATGDALFQATLQFQEIADYAESEYPMDATVAIIARTGEQLADAALKQAAAALATAGSTPEGEGT